LWSKNANAPGNGSFSDLFAPEVVLEADYAVAVADDHAESSVPRRRQVDRKRVQMTVCGR
jgi:hypothetical protein